VNVSFSTCHKAALQVIHRNICDGGNAYDNHGYIMYPFAILMNITGVVSKNTVVALAEEMDVRINLGHTSVGIKESPPLNAKYLFYLFLDAKNCDALVGDLEERHRLMRKKFGARRANFWYWTQALTSVGPIVWAWGKKIVMKPVVAAITWAAAKHLLSDGSWLLMITEMWKRIRL
jgi:hypothetical protein